MSKVEKVVLVKDHVTAYRCGQVGHIVVGGDVNPAHTAARVQIATLPKGWWPVSDVLVTGTLGAVLLSYYDGAVRVEGSATNYYVACSYLIDMSKT